MSRPLLLNDRSPVAQVLVAIAVPAVVGLICGALLGVSAQAYILSVALAGTGGVVVGYEHPGALEGAGRGLAAGMLLGTFVLFGYAVAGLDYRTGLPSTHVLLPVQTTLIGASLGLFGGALRARRARTGVARSEAPGTDGRRHRQPSDSNGA